MLQPSRFGSIVILGIAIAGAICADGGGSPAQAQLVPSEAQLDLDGDVDLVMRWLTGRWDNAEQIARRKALGQETRGTILPQSYEIEPITAPALGENVLQVRQYTDGALSLESYYIVSPDDAGHRVLIRVATAKIPASDRTRGRSQLQAAALQVSDMHFLDEGCTSQWLRTGALFRVRILGRCVLYKDEKTGADLNYQIDSSLTANELAMLTFNRDANGEIVWLAQGSTPRIFNKTAVGRAGVSDAGSAAVARVRAWFAATYAAELEPLAEQFAAPGFGWTGSEMRVYSAPADIVSGYARARAERRVRTPVRQGELLVARAVMVRDTSVIVYTRFTRRDAEGNLVEIADAHYLVVSSAGEWKVAGIIVSKDSRVLAN
jgi:hypothetical protein